MILKPNDERVLERATLEPQYSAIWRSLETLTEVTDGLLGEGGDFSDLE